MLTNEGITSAAYTMKAASEQMERTFGWLQEWGDFKMQQLEELVVRLEEQEQRDADTDG